MSCYIFTLHTKFTDLWCACVSFCPFASAVHSKTLICTVRSHLQRSVTCSDKHIHPHDCRQLQPILFQVIYITIHINASFVYSYFYSVSFFSALESSSNVNSCVLGCNESLHYTTFLLFSKDSGVQYRYFFPLVLISKLYVSNCP